MLVRALILLSFPLFAQTQVVLLGTGTPNPEPDRSGPAVAIVIRGKPYIVDAGPGIVRRAAEAQRKGIAGLAADQLSRAFLTHLHSDHTAGLPDLMFTAAVMGRAEPMLIQGPPGTARMVNLLLQAYSEDIEIRLKGGEPALPVSYDIKGKDTAPGLVYRDDHVRVTAISVPHGSWKQAFAYRFETADGTVVISGDTTFSGNLIKEAKDCDLLIHEVYCEKGWQRRTPDWQKYHASFHTSAPDVGRVATKSGAKKLVLYHHLPMGEPESQVIEEVRRTYKGPLHYGRDLDVFEVKR